MASPANVLSRPRGVALPWQVLLAVAAGLVAVGILIAAERVQPRLALYWALVDLVWIYLFPLLYLI